MTILVTLLLCLGINSLLLFIMFQFFKGKIHKSIQSSELIEHVRKEMDALVVEMNHTTERNIALIEERIVRLNKLLKDADNRIVVLQRQQKPLSGTDTYDTLGRPPRPSGSKQEQAEQTVKERVLEMAGEGFEHAVIAGKLGLPLGEVDLIVSLESSRGGTNE